MSVNLPKPVAAYIAADNRSDAEAVAQCFAANAVVQDEGQTITGQAAIKLWNAETKAKYQHQLEPLASAHIDGNTVVTARVIGDFPGSPIELKFVFWLEGEKIGALEIG